MKRQCNITDKQVQIKINQANKQWTNTVQSKPIRKPTFQMQTTYKRRIRQCGSIGGTSINIIHNNANTYDFNFIMAKQSYLADDTEISKAMSMEYNKELKHNDVSYLKT